MQRRHLSPSRPGWLACCGLWVLLAVGRAGAQSPAAAPRGGRPDLLSAVDEITREVSAMRGLQSTTPFQRGVLSRTEIVQKLHDRMAKEYSKEEVRIESAVLKRLGLLPAGTDYEQTLLNLLGEQVAGFYDPYVRTLYIADWLPLDMQRPALAHEIEHALQDQHFDLRKFSQPFKDDGDRQLARSAVVEGDGTAVMLDYATRGSARDSLQMPAVIAKLGKQMMELSMGATPAFQKAPAALRETLVFPYAAGLEFVAARRAEQTSTAEVAKAGSPSRPPPSSRSLLSWRRVDDLFRDPPESTEQILHPEKYAQRDHPVRITAGPLPSLAPRKEVRRDVMGELVFRIWFASLLSPTHAEEAAAGWGGDRLVAYEQPGDALPTLVSLSAWDSDSDASEAEEAARKVLLTMAGQKELATGKPTGPSGLFRDKGGLSYGLMRRGRLLLLVCGAPKGSESTLAAEVFANFKVEWPLHP